MLHEFLETGSNTSFWNMGKIMLHEFLEHGNIVNLGTGTLYIKKIIYKNKKYFLNYIIYIIIKINIQSKYSNIKINLNI